MIDIWGRQNHPLQAAVGCVPYAKKIIHIERSFNMIYSHEVEMMCPVAQGANHGYRLRRSRTFPVLHTVSAGVHLSREHVSFH